MLSAELKCHYYTLESLLSSAFLAILDLFFENHFYEMNFNIILSSLTRCDGGCWQTGTLTEDGLDMWGVLPVEERRFKVAVKDMTQLETEPLLLGMASCHSLTLINGALSGDPLDVKVSP